jgi:catechol 2,3-dioxygenase
VPRLPAETRLGPVRLQIGDLDRSLEYYTQLLGLRAIDRAEGEASLGAAGDTSQTLVHLVERRGARKVRPHSRLGLYHFALLVPERAALGRLLQHVSSRGARPGMADHAVSESLYFWDPDGLGIEVSADRPRSAWRYNGAELQLTVDPLNVADLVREAGSEGWTGMPAGTVMGHVHLHVGNLDEESAFYHDGIGFDRTAWSFPGALFLAAGGYHHHLGTNTWAAGAPPATDDDARLIDWQIVVSSRADVDAISERLARAGRALAADGAARDPWGTTVRITAEAG